MTIIEAVKSTVTPKMAAEHFRYKEVVELADVLDYDICWVPRKSEAFVGRGGAAERLSFRTGAEAKDAKLVTTTRRDNR